jgi:hypothetical protein
LKIFKLLSLFQNKLAPKKLKLCSSQFKVFKKIFALFTSCHLKMSLDLGFEFVKIIESVSQEISSFLKFIQEILLIIILFGFSHQKSSVSFLNFHGLLLKKIISSSSISSHF